MCTGPLCLKLNGNVIQQRWWLRSQRKNAIEHFFAQQVWHELRIQLAQRYWTFAHVTLLCVVWWHMRFLWLLFWYLNVICCVPEDVSGKHRVMEIVRNSETHDVFNGARLRICETVQPLSVLWPKDLTTPDLLSPSHLTLPRRSVGIIVLCCYTHVYIILYNMFLIL